MKGRAETTLQKFFIILRLLNVWERNPSLRLGQLIANAFENKDHEMHIFYKEDEDFVKELEEKFPEEEK